MIDKVLKMWNNYCWARRTQFSSAKQISVLIERATWDGIKADQRKSDALVNVERPTNLSALQRLFRLAK